MKKIAFILLLLIFPKIFYGQEPTVKEWEYYQELSEEANKEYKTGYEIINIDTLYNSMFKNKSAKIQIDTLTNWKILFECKCESTWLVFDNLYEIFLKYKDNIKNESIKKSYIDSKIYRGIDLKNLGISSNFLITQDILQGFPPIIERNDKLNRKWVPISFENYLTLRYVLAWRLTIINFNISYTE